MNCRVILILGGSGALGSDITDFLRMETDYLVYTLGRKESNDIKADLEKSNIELTFNPDIIINCAGIVHNHIHASTFNQGLIDRDRKISSGIFQLLKNYPPKLFLNISSVSVYGVDKGLSYNENTPINPKSGYAKCKVESESLFSTLEHTKVVNLRLPLILTERKVGNIHKLNEFIKKFGLILFTNKKGLKSVVLSTDIAKNIENFIHVKPGIYNFKSGDLTLETLAEIHLSNKSSKPIIIPAIGYSLLKTLNMFLGIFKPVSRQMNNIQKLFTDLTFSDEKIRLELKKQNYEL